MGIYLSLEVGNTNGEYYSDYVYENHERKLNTVAFNPKTEYCYDSVLKSSYYFGIIESAGMDYNEEAWMNKDKLGYSNLKKVKQMLKTLKFRIDYDVDNCRAGIEAELTRWNWDVDYSRGHEDRLDSVYESLCADIELVTELHNKARQLNKAGIKVRLSQG